MESSGGQFKQTQMAHFNPLCTLSLIILSISVSVLAGKTRTKDKYRVVYTDKQRTDLEMEFRNSRYITIKRKSELAGDLGLSERQVSVAWCAHDSQSPVEWLINQSNCSLNIVLDIGENMVSKSSCKRSETGPKEGGEPKEGQVQKWQCGRGQWWWCSRIGWCASHCHTVSQW